MRKLYFYIGTEAELIKLFPVIVHCIKLNIPITLISNGQNNLQDSILYEGEIKSRMIFLGKRFRSTPNEFLLVGFWSRSMWLSGWAMTALVTTFHFLLCTKKNEKKLPLLIVHGDTISTVIGAFCGRILGYKIFHIESGLTSKNLFNPFPEEIDRRLAGKLCNTFFCPTEVAFDNLQISSRQKKIFTHGNTMWEMLQFGLERHKSLDKFKNYFILVIHRQETLANKKLFFEIIKKVNENKDPEMKCIFILHFPTRKFLEALNAIDDIQSLNNWILLDRLPFFEFVDLLKNANYVLTDGGTNQEECFYLGLPCYILREQTERNEGLNHNVVLTPNFMAEIPEFMRSFYTYKKAPVKFNIFPSQIIASEIISEASKEK